MHLGDLWKSRNTSFPIHIAIFFDVLSPIHCWSIAFQQEEHYPVKAAQQIQGFNWTMAPLKILIESSLEGHKTCFRHYKQLLDKIDAGNNGQVYYQDVKLSKYTDTKKYCFNFLWWYITCISEKAERKLENLSTSPVFFNLVSLLDTSIWLSLTKI